MRSHNARTVGGAETALSIVNVFREFVVIRLILF